jgi:hypothetical protein
MLRHLLARNLKFCAPTTSQGSRESRANQKFVSVSRRILQESSRNLRAD